MKSLSTSGIPGLIIHFGDSPPLGPLAEHFRSTRTIASIDFRWPKQVSEPNILVRQGTRSWTVSSFYPDFKSVKADYSHSSRVRRLCETAFFLSLDRVYVEPIAMAVRASLLDSYIHRWTQIVSDLSPTPAPKTALYSGTPHMPWDIVLSAVLQALDWSVFALQPSASNRHMSLSRIEGVLPVFQKDPGYVDTPKGSAGPTTANERIERSQTQNAVLKSPWRMGFRSKISREILRNIFGFIFLGPGVPYWKFSAIHRSHLALQWAAQRQRLRRWLKQNGVRVLPDGRFCYFALHYQPERTTVPEAGEFWFQSRAIEMLIAALPADFQILVAEHPRQIGFQSPDLRQLLFRNEAQYALMAADSRVSIVHPEVDSREMIEKASLVATCTGSSIWEGLIRGKPGVTFGNTWYSKSEAVINGAQSNDLSRDIDSLLDMEPEQIRFSAKQLLRWAEEVDIPLPPSLANGLPLPERKTLPGPDSINFDKVAKRISWTIAQLLPLGPEKARLERNRTA